MGLAQEVAYSSLLAFFPAVIALIGLLDLVNAYGALQSFLDPVAPKAVTQLIDSFKQDSGGSGSVFALVLGSALAVWAASGAMGSVVKAVNRTYERPETRPFWKVKLISVLLVLVRHSSRARCCSSSCWAGRSATRSRTTRTAAGSHGCGTSCAGRSPSAPYSFSSH